MSARIRLRKRDNDPVVVALALARVAGLLEREDWAVRAKSRDGTAPVDTLQARSPRGFSVWDPKALATRGKLVVVVGRRSLRVRYTPTVLGFAVTALGLGYAVGWPIREVVQYLATSRAAAIWFGSASRYVLQYVIGFALAYPALRWRFTRMCRKAVRLPARAWQRYASAAHAWRRVGIAAGIFGWPLVESINWWLIRLGAALGDRATLGVPIQNVVEAVAGPTVRMIVLGAAVFAVDWDAVLFEGAGWVLDRWTRWRERRSGGGRDIEPIPRMQERELRPKVRSAGGRSNHQEEPCDDSA